MGISIGPGISIGAGISLGQGGIVTTGLTLWLDAANSASYPGSGSTWTDISGNGANISLVNSPTWTSGPPAFFTFASASSQRGTGSTSNVLSATAYTKSAWFYLNSLTDNNLVSSDTGGHFSFFGGTNRMYNGHTNWVGFPTSYPSTATFNLNTWYYFAVTFDTTNGMTLYINGVQDSTYTAQKTGLPGNGSTNIACFGAGNFLNGRMAVVACYNRVLSAQEVQNNFDSDKTRFGF